MTKEVDAGVNPTQMIERFHAVCKRVINADPTYFPRSNYQGKTIYFCTESCLNAFCADPERFYCAHNKAAPE